LHGTNASEATGSMTYSVYSDSLCTNLVKAGTAEPITTPGTIPASAPAKLTGGTYYWQASYSGDTSNSASSSSCGSEVETVGTTPTVSTTDSGGGEVGGSFSDSATLSGFSGSVKGESVNFNLYPSLGACNSATGAVAGSPVIASLSKAGTTKQSSKITVSTPGTYYWQATYPGDGSNNPASSSCSSEPITITAKALPLVAAQLF
jgi:hypothetical protein